MVTLKKKREPSARRPFTLLLVGVFLVGTVTVSLLLPSRVPHFQRFLIEESQQQDATTKKLDAQVDVAATEEDLWRLSNIGKTSLCVPWAVNSDHWWIFHVDWEVFHEDDAHYCFRIIPNEEKAQALRKLHRTQFPSDCSNMKTRMMISSGWGADFIGVIGAIKHAFATGEPVQIGKSPWHYASPKPFNLSTAVCPSQDMFCYFLPLSNCTRSTEESDFHSSAGMGEFTDELGRLVYEYVSRPQTWLRRKVYGLTAKQQIQQPCTAIHVRRSDVVLHKRWSRAYHSMAEYMNASNRIERNVLLLTDDHNAIGEAKVEFPEYHWMYIHRARYRGSEGGWEQQLPSQDPAFEVTVCNSMIKSWSRFGRVLYGEVWSANRTAWTVDVDEAAQKDTTTLLLNQNNSASVDLSRSYESSK